MLEHADVYPYQLFITREQIENSEDRFLTGISLRKFYRYSWYFESDASLEELADILADNSSHQGYERISVQTRRIRFVDYYIVESRYESTVYDPQNSTMIRVWNVFLKRNDALVWLTFESSDEDFEIYEPFFEEFLTAYSFLCDFLTDNVALEYQILMEIQDIFSVTLDDVDDVEDLLGRFCVLQNRHPAYPPSTLFKGRFLLGLLLGMERHPEDEMFQMVEELYLESISQFMGIKELDEDEGLTYYLSQAYFQLAELYYFQGRFEEALVNYETSSELTDLPGVQDMIKRTSDALNR